MFSAKIKQQLKVSFAFLKLARFNYQYKNYEGLESAITNYVDYYNQRRIKTKLVVAST